MKQFYKAIFTIILLTLSSFHVSAQVKLYQLSGIVSDEQYKYPLAYTAVYVEGTSRVAVASSMGFFSIAVAAGEMITFTHVGYAAKSFVIPDTLHSDMVSIGVFLAEDTVELNVVEIYPWPSRDEFHDAFVGLQIAEEYKLSAINFPGINFHPKDTVPPPPTIMNPISFLYENIVQPIEYNKKKKKTAKTLPKWE